MTLNLAGVNMRGLRDLSKCAHLLGDILIICVDVITVQETHFICTADSRVLENNFVIFSADESRYSCSYNHFNNTGHRASGGTQSLLGMTYFKANSTSTLNSKQYLSK